MSDTNISTKSAVQDSELLQTNPYIITQGKRSEGLSISNFENLKILKNQYNQDWNQPWYPSFPDDLMLNTDYNFFQIIRNRVVKYNESYDITIVGSRGLGKSASGLACALLIDPNFNIKDDVCFSVEEWIDRVDSLKGGGVVILDEVGTEGSLSSRTSMSKGNRSTSDIVQLCRTDRIITIYISVDDMRIDKRVRQLSSVMSTPLKKMDDEETQGHGFSSEIDIKWRKTKPTGESRPEQYSDSGDSYLIHETKNLRYAQKGLVKSVIVPHPPIRKWQQYSKKRDVKLAEVKDMGLTQTKVGAEAAKELAKQKREESKRKSSKEQ